MVCMRCRKGYRVEYKSIVQSNYSLSATVTKATLGPPQ
jgi:hypothetical protein